jgi:hypothetical protein
MPLRLVIHLEDGIYKYGIAGPRGGSPFDDGGSSRSCEYWGWDGVLYVDDPSMDALGLAAKFFTYPKRSPCQQLGLIERNPGKETFSFSTEPIPRPG